MGIITSMNEHTYTYVLNRVHARRWSIPMKLQYLRDIKFQTVFTMLIKPNWKRCLTVITLSRADYLQIVLPFFFFNATTLCSSAIHLLCTKPCRSIHPFGCQSRKFSINMPAVQTFTFSRIAVQICSFLPHHVWFSKWFAISHMHRSITQSIQLALILFFL